MLKVMVHKINIGAIFCHVSSVSVVNHDRFIVTFGSHQWHGGMPSFISSLVVRRISIIVGACIISGDDFGNTASNMVQRMIIEAVAWVMKYIIDGLVSWLFEVVMRGMKDSIFSSRPIHIITQEDAEIDIRVPKIRVDENRIFWGIDDSIKDEGS